QSKCVPLEVNTLLCTGAISTFMSDFCKCPEARSSRMHKTLALETAERV
ncbi:hypothetical protein AVEN_226160-1, partial [Araneus ventricosus]